MKKITFTLLTFALAFSAFAQDDWWSPLIINTPSGYLNVRERPTVNSPIVNRFYQYEVFFDARFYFANDVIHHKEFPRNWIPVAFDFVSTSDRCIENGRIDGFVYRPFTLRMRDLPLLDLKSGSDEQIVVGNDTLQVVLSLRPFDIDAHEIRFADWDKNLIVSVNGRFPLGVGGSHFLIDHVPYVREIAGLSVYQNDKRWELSIDRIWHYFNPGMSVNVGLHGELYIHIGVGDGSETHNICLSVVNGEIIHITHTDPH